MVSLATQVQGFVERVSDAHSQRTNAYHAWANALRTYTENKDVNAMTSRRKKAEIDARLLTQQISELQADIKPITHDVADKVIASTCKISFIHLLCVLS